MNFGTITMLGFWFVNMTAINRVLEGTFITAADVGVLNTMGFRVITLFGYIPIPILNVQAIAVGMGRLMKFDYSFFGGNAGFIQYMLYSVSFAVAVTLFLIIIGGLISNFLNRVR